MLSSARGIWTDIRLERKTQALIEEETNEASEPDRRRHEPRLGCARYRNRERRNSVEAYLVAIVEKFEDSPIGRVLVLWGGFITLIVLEFQTTVTIWSIAVLTMTKVARNTN